MAYTKKEISNALETITAPGEGTNLIESGAVKNIVTFDKEVALSENPLEMLTIESVKNKTKITLSNVTF